VATALRIPAVGISQRRSFSCIATRVRKRDIAWRKAMVIESNYKTRAMTKNLAPRLVLRRRDVALNSETTESPEMNAIRTIHGVGLLTL
jgi:hypothetical protein